MKKIERIGYTFLDLLSDIGGVQGILLSFFSILVSVFNNTYFDDYLVSKLFKYREPAPRRQSHHSGLRSSSQRRVAPEPSIDHVNAQQFQQTRYCGICSFILSLIPSCCLCCPLNRNQRALSEARSMLESETDLVGLIQKLRLFQLAIEQLVPYDRLTRLKLQSKFKLIDIGKSRKAKLKSSSNSQSAAELEI